VERNKQKEWGFDSSNWRGTTREEMNEIYDFIDKLKTENESNKTTD
jgi:hypothetical protein